MNTSPRIAMSSLRRTPAQPGSAVNTSPFGAKCTAQLEDPALVFTSFDQAKIAYVPPSVKTQFVSVQHLSHIEGGRRWKIIVTVTYRICCVGMMLE